MNSNEIRSQLEDIIFGIPYANHIYDKPHGDCENPEGIVFDMIPMFEDLEVLVRNILRLQEMQISGKRNDDAVKESRERLTSCSCAVLRMIDTLKSVIARSTYDEFATGLVRVAMAKHLGNYHTVNPEGTAQA